MRLPRSWLRWPSGLLLLAGATVLALELFAVKGDTLIAALDQPSRETLLNQLASFAGTAVGFLLAAVTILVSLSPDRPIVADLRRGESFGLVVINLLAASIWLLALTVLAIVGAALDTDDGPLALEVAIEVVAIAALVELVIGGVFFAIVTYKVAKYD